MIRLCDLVLYASLALGANAALGDTADLEALREGSMKKLIFASQPIDVAEIPFESASGGEITLAQYHGKHILVNFWATWCAPCRKEMPALSALQGELGGEAFEIVTIATGRNPAPAMQRLFDEIGVTNLPLHRDPREKLSREMAVFGLPVSIILNPDGDEIARLRGDADWDSESAKAILSALISTGDGES